MNIRQIILVLTLALGASLVVVTALLIQEELVRLDTAQRLEASNDVREHLLVASAALGRERTDTYVQLIASPDDSGSTIDDLRGRVDTALREAGRELEEGYNYLRDADRSIAVLVGSEALLRKARQAVDEARGTNEHAKRQEAAAVWLDTASNVVRALQSSRLDVLQNNRPVDPVLSAEASLRTYSDVLHEAIAYNEAIGAAVLSGEKADQSALKSAIERNAGRMALVWQLISNELTPLLAPRVRDAITDARLTYNRTYDPLQISLSGAAPNLTPQKLLQSWTSTSNASLESLTLMQERLLESSRARLDSLVEQAQRSALLVSLLAIGGAAAAILILLVVRRRVIQPLRQVTEAMVRLAANDLTTPVPRVRVRDEVGQMTNSLRTFKANAILRQRTQRELERVYVSLQQTYDQLRRDLEAAAIIQRSMLPASATIDSVRHTGLYAPSSLIAGDTYNVIRRPDGVVGFFQIDVAGHGAAAALVSVAGQHTLSQAILTRRQEDPLEEILAEVNRQWPADLPYFTTIFGEIDPVRPRARIVQAGHPCPLLICANGKVHFLGESGFPVGMLLQATYESLEFEFAAGDRLLIYSDGVTETENRAGAFYSEDRLLTLVSKHAKDPTADILRELQASLRSWRGGDTLTDDVSALVVERTTSWDPTHAIH